MDKESLDKSKYKVMDIEPFFDEEEDSDSSNKVAELLDEINSIELEIVAKKNQMKKIKADVQKSMDELRLNTDFTSKGITNEAGRKSYVLLNTDTRDDELFNLEFEISFLNAHLNHLLRVEKWLRLLKVEEMVTKHRADFKSILKTL